MHFHIKWIVLFPVMPAALPVPGKERLGLVIRAGGRNVSHQPVSQLGHNFQGSTTNL